VAASESEVVNDDLRALDQQRAEEFTHLYSSCQRRLYLYIAALIGNPWDAYDILQDTNLVLWQKFDHFQAGTSFIAWAREVARYRVLRYRQMHANDTPTFEPSVLDALAMRLNRRDDRHDSLYSDALPACIEKLSADDRELIRLRYTDRATIKMLADKLRRSVNAISLALGRIRRSLRKCIDAAAQEHATEEVQ
jgi:RNA polymerase sigma-70 factor, ECF subfamily